MKSGIANIVCKLGGDVYTEESTRASLAHALEKAQGNAIRFDVRNDKWIMFSDHHRGAKNGADDFERCEKNYLTALEHYHKEGYSLCVMGDAEELWEEFPRKVIRKNSASFLLEKKFHDEGRYMRLWGNHDDIWGDPIKVLNLLQPQYGYRHLDVPGSILLEAKDGEKSLGRILLVHGHQGTQNEGNNAFAKWVLHNIWRPIQIIARFSCNTPATDWELREERDKIIYHWVTAQPALILIAGHTHAPVFKSYTHRARLLSELSASRARMNALTQDQREEESKKIATLSSDLQRVESKLSEKEKTESKPIENPLPCYFNAGCCCFADGDITGIEISNGEIRLVRWSHDDGEPAQNILQSGNLEKIFQVILQQDN